MSLPIVTNENYFSVENNMAYMGSSQYKAFMKCEAAALAEAKGEWATPPTTAMLVGSYVDAYFEGTLSTFKAHHPELFKKNGELLKDYANANDIIARMEDDELYMALMSGKHQVVKTGEIAGVPFKIKVDSLLSADQCREIAERFPGVQSAFGPFLNGCIVDQKVMKDIENMWSEEEHARVSFVRAYGYDIQGAIYQAIEGNMLPFVLAIGTKQEPSDLAALSVPDSVLQEKLYEVKQNAPRFQRIKQGLEKPHRCEKCAYCRATKKLSCIVSYDMV